MSWKETAMRAKRVFIVLGPGLVASLVLSPGIAAAASAAPAPARVAVAAPSISGPVGQAAPPAPYPSGYSNGLHAGIAAAEAGKPRSAIPLPPATGHTVGQGNYYAGFVDGYALGESPGTYGVRQSINAAALQYMEARQAAIDADVRIEPLPKDQPVLPALTTPTQTGQGTAPQVPNTSSQGSTVSTTPTQTGQSHDTGSQGTTVSTTPTQTGQSPDTSSQGTTEPTTPTETGQGSGTGLQGPTESVTPTHETGQVTAPQGQDTGLQGPTESVTPTHEIVQETVPQGQDTGAQYDTTFEDQGFGSEGGFSGE